MRRALALLVALGLAACTTAHPPPSLSPLRPLPEVAEQPTREDRYPAREVSFADGVKGLPDLVYSQPPGHRPLTLDLYLPPDAAARPASGFPLVLQIHGGDWLDGDKRHNGAFADFAGVLASLASKGYVVASIEYRLSAEARFPAQIHDVKVALRWLRLKASRYGIDPARAMTWGEGAGAQLATLAALGCGAAALEPPPGQGSAPPLSDHADCVQGSVAWSGVFDLARIAEQARTAQALSRDDPGAPEWRLLGCFGQECAPGQIAAASPASHVDRDDPPMLLIAGAADRTIPTRQTLEMAATLKGAGVPHELVVLPGIDHHLIGKTPVQTRTAHLKALAATFRFIDQTIGPAAPVKP